MTVRTLGHGLSALRARYPPEQLPFPTSAQLDLLKAALLPAEQAAPAWRRWKSRGVALETVDEASGRMFSQLWSNREAAGIGTEDLPVLKGAYRQALANNAVTLAAAFETVQPLVDAGITVLFFKGAAMIAIAQGRLGLRRIVDVDVLIPEADAERAITILTRAGREAKPGDEIPRIRGVHGWSCVTPAGSALDLHWWAFKTAGDDRVMFETAREATLLGRPVLIPSTTQALVSAVGTAFSGHPPGAPLRWIADAMLIFQLEASTIEWDRLVERARRPGLHLGLASGLEFLASEFAAPVPEWVLTELQRRSPVSWRERGAYWAAVKRLPWLGTSLIQHLELHRTRRLRYPADVPWDFLGHLAQVTGARTGRRRDFLLHYGLHPAQGIANAGSPLPPEGGSTQR